MQEFDNKQSTIQIDKWEKLARIFEAATTEEMGKIEKELGVDEVCILGLTKSLNIDTHKDCGFNNSKVTSLLYSLGFEKKEVIEHSRMCMVSGCDFVSSNMFGTINHLIGWHKIPHKNVAPIIREMKNDDRKANTTLINTLKSVPMGSD